MWARITDYADSVGLPVEGTHSQPPRRHHVRYLTEKRMTAAAVTKFAVALNFNGVWTARTTGALTPTGRPDLANPHRRNVIAHDGKITDSPIKPKANPPVDKTTGEIHRHRVDPAVGLYAEAGDESATFAWGTKFGFVSCRTPQANQRVFLGVHHVTAGRGYGNESSNAVELIAFINDIAAATSPHGYRDTGIHAVVNDAAMSGTHITALHHALGVPVHVPTHTAPNIEHNGKKYKAHALPPVPCGKTAHKLWAAGGGFWTETRLVDGTITYTPLTRRTTRLRSGNEWLITATITIPCRHGNHTITQRVDQTNIDTKTGFNRGKHIRWHDEHSETNKRVYGMRADTESGNAQFENAYYRNKIPAYGVRKQMIHAIMWCLMQNAAALAAFHNNPARIT